MEGSIGLRELAAIRVVAVPGAKNMSRFICMFTSKERINGFTFPRSSRRQCRKRLRIIERWKRNYKRFPGPNSNACLRKKPPWDIPGPQSLSLVCPGFLEGTPLLARFLPYVEKVFGFRQMIRQLIEPRKKPQIPLESIFGGAFLLSATGHTSLNSFEPSLRDRQRLAGLLGPHRPSVDTLARVYAQMDPQPLREMLVNIAHKLKRNKVFELSQKMPLRFVAIDGHEFFSSYARCCEECSTRVITDGEGNARTQYYHRGVFVTLVGFDVDLVLDVEFCRKGEGEWPAAERLLKRVFANYSRFFDAVLGDELYATAPFFNLCRTHAKHPVAVIRGEHRVLLQDAQAIFATTPPEQFTSGNRVIQCWDQEGFNTLEGFDGTVRVMKTEETIHKRERIAGQWIQKQEQQTWSWATTLTKNQASMRVLHRAGHLRWEVENNTFHSLVTHWGLDHCYHHAPKALVNFVLTLLIAFVLLGTFFHRNLKPSWHHPQTLIGLAKELFGSLWTQVDWLFPLGQPP